MDLGYAIVPFAAWFVAGGLKFMINSVRSGRLAFDEIGYGGLPSSHSAIVSGVAALIAIREGVSHPAFGVAVAVAIVVILDATSLRRQVGRHAQALNQLSRSGLRERIGHTSLEIGAGIVVGIFCAWLVGVFFSFIGA